MKLIRHHSAAMGRVEREAGDEFLRPAAGARGMTMLAERASEDDDDFDDDEEYEDEETNEEDL